MNKLFHTILFLLLISASGCTNDNDPGIMAGISNTLSGDSEEAAKSFGNAVKNIGEGLDKSLFQVKVYPMLNVLTSGIQITRGVLSQGTGTNSIKMYVIFHKNFSGKLAAKVIDKSGNETGRSYVFVNGREDESKFVDLAFNPDVSLFLASHVEIEVKK